MADPQELRFPSSWGGARDGAGRPKKLGARGYVPHVVRPSVSRHRPHHVTVRFTRRTWNLRSQRCFAPIRAAFVEVAKREGVRVVHFSVQHNHLHLMVEADDRRALSGAMRALLIRIARGVNGVMGARGRRIAERYHEHVLKTPSETRNALKYVLRNRAHHLAQWGSKAAGPTADPFSSGSPELAPLLKPPRSWLLQNVAF